MRLYIFSDKIDSTTSADLSAALARICKHTDTSKLVTAFYLSSHRLNSRGTAYVQRWLTPASFHSSRGYWAFTRRFGTPPDLPEKYRLIKLHLNPGRRYPRIEHDIYQWKWQYTSLIDQAALLFAHELHHYRRYHLGLHPGEGEHAANRWAEQFVRELGFNVAGERLPVKKQRNKKRSRQKRIWFDPYREFRQLKTGDTVLINYDQKKKYAGQHATVVRPIRSNSKRIVIETSDGKTWRWPMPWLKTE